LISLITVSALKKAGFDKRRQALGAGLLLTSGYLVAYSSQGMTDVFSAMLLLGSVYCLFLWLESHSSRYLAVASLLTLLNVMTRYEAWLFLAITLLYAFYLFVRMKTSLRRLAEIIAYAIPSALFILVWLYYNELVSGSYFGFANWITQSVSQNPPTFVHNPVLTLANLAEVLLLSNGLFWLALADVRHIEAITPVVKFATILFAVYTVFFIYSTYLGFSNGWVRLYLYFVPFSVVSFMSKNYKRDVFYLILGISVVLGVIGFSENVVLHQFASSGSP
jgi:4-amino-4-deoxy-L-arabinose transferase-like glycosyltransferase